MRPRLLLCFSLLAAWVAAQPCKLPALGGERTYPGAEAARYCTPQKLGIREASYQILVDDSGSMRGVGRQLPDALAWIEQALSHMLRFEMAWSRSRGCFFSAARPVASCQSARISPTGFQGSGGTTLDTAIASAKDYDLTVILTDGAGASGSPTGVCASGVDAACVGRALAETLQPRAGEPAGIRGGLWLVPLMAQHAGPLYTEQRAELSSIDPARIRETVAKETKASAEADSFRLDRDGQLFYQYKGPRVLLLLVLARRSDLGRAFIAALQARRDYSQIQSIDSLAGFSGKLAALPAVELFPGVATGLRWTQLRVAQPACVTFDARIRPDGKLAIACSNPNDEAIVTLTAASTPESLDCARLLNLPVLRTELRADRGLPSIRQAAWRGSALSPSDPLQLRLHLACSRTWQGRLSSACATAGRIVSRKDIPSTVEALLAVRPGNAATNLVRSLSSSSIIYSPHRAFQLTETLERFYRTVESLDPNPAEAVLGQVDLCWIQ
jgi:hypothetical protein